MVYSPVMNAFRLTPEETGGFGDLASALSKGMQVGFQPAVTSSDLLQKMMESKYKNEQAKYVGPQAEADIAYKRAESGLIPYRQKLLEAQAAAANREATDPFGNKIAPGAIGQAMWLENIKNKYGADSDLYKNAKEQLDLENKRLQSMADYRQTMGNSVSYRLLPTPEKQRLIATAVGMGIDPSEASQLLASGQTLESIAQQKGINLKDITPIYPLSGETIKQMNNRRAFAAEIKNLEKNVGTPLENIGPTLFGYSPSQIVGAIGNMNPDEQGKILAARALQPELAALRMKAAGGTVGIEAIREMKNAALGNLKIFEPLASKEARHSMNKYISEWIDQAAETYNDNLQHYASLGQKPSKKMVSIRNKRTGQVVRVSAEEARRRGIPNV